MRYSSKTVHVDAVQFSGFYATPWPADVMADQEEGPACYVVTNAKGRRAYLDSGDWIVYPPYGQDRYVMSDDVFRATFEPVEG